MPLWLICPFQWGFFILKLTLVPVDAIDIERTLTMSKKGKIETFEFYYGLIWMTICFFTKLVTAIYRMEYDFLNTALVAFFMYGIIKLEHSIQKEKRMSERFFQFCVSVMGICFIFLFNDDFHTYFPIAAFIYAVFFGVIEKSSRVEK